MPVRYGQRLGARLFSARPVRFRRRLAFYKVGTGAPCGRAWLGVGTRTALGATPRDVLRLVIGQGSRLATVGIAIGLAGAFGLTRVLERMLFGVTASDIATYTSAALILGAVAIVACLVPALRAAGIDPIAALRQE